jgi:hypothetical protein
MSIYPFHERLLTWWRYSSCYWLKTHLFHLSPPSTVLNQYQQLVHIKQALSKASEDLEDAVKAKKANAKPKSKGHNIGSGSDDGSGDKDA